MKIKTSENLIIKVEGDNYLNDTSNYSIEAKYLIITGDGTLTIKNTISAIHCQGITIEDTNLNITAGKYVIFNVGDNPDITINNSKFTFETESYALVNSGNVYINDSEVKNVYYFVNNTKALYVNNSRVIVDNSRTFTKYDTLKYISGVSEVSYKSETTYFDPAYVHLGNDIKMYQSSDGITYQESDITKIPKDSNLLNYVKYKRLCKSRYP